jgi:hypothetical protein
MLTNTSLIVMGSCMVSMRDDGSLGILLNNGGIKCA